MTNIIRCCILGLTLLSLGAKAQYRVYHDRPILNGHYLSIGFMDMDFKSFATWNLRYETFLADGRFSLSMEYANISNLKALKKYVDRNYPEIGQDFDSIGLQPVRSDKLIPKKFEIGGSYNFHQKMKRLVKPISLYSYRMSYNTTVHVYTLRRISVFRFTGIRGGLGVMRTPYFGYLNTDDLAKYNVHSDPLPPSGEDFFFATRNNQKYLYLGIGRSAIFNIKVTDLRGAGVRNSFTTAYFDLLFLLGSDFDDVKDYNTNQRYTLRTIDRSDLRKFGYRLGIRSQSVRYFGVGTVIELGKFTGGSLIPKEIRDAFEDVDDISRYINFARVGIYFSLTGPLQQQHIHTKW